MSNKIKLVQGDNLPWIRLTLTDTATGNPIVVSDPDVTVRLHFTTDAGEVLNTLVCEKLSGGSNNVVRFNFPDGVLDVEPGAYKGEVEIDFDGQIQTIYDVLKFQVRAQFA